MPFYDWHWKSFFHWLPLLSLPKAAWTDLFNSSFSTCLASLSRVKTFPWFDKATYRIQYYRVSPISQSFLQEVGGAKAGTKLIYNGKIEKLKKIWMEIIYIWPWESLYWYAINAFYLFFQYKYHAIFSNHSVLGTKVR